MYSLGFFLPELHCVLQCLPKVFLVCSLNGMYIPRFVLNGCCVSELHAYLCPHCNLRPDAVYCCFTRTALFTKLFICLYDLS